MKQPDGNTQQPHDQSITLRRSSLSALGVFIKDYLTGESVPNEFWTHLGYSASEMRMDHWLDRVHPEDRDTARQLLEASSHSQLVQTRESYRIKGSDGEYRWVLSTGVVDEWLPDGTPRRYVGLDVDVTELHELQENLQNAQDVAEVRAMEAETLRTAGAVIASSLDTYDAVDRVLQQLEGLVRVDVALVFEKQKRSIVPVLVHDPPSESEQRAIEFFADKFGRTTLNDAMRSKTFEVFREPSSRSRFWMVVPLVFAAGSIGVLALSRSGGSEFVGHEIRFAMSIADFLTIAMKNARLYKQMSTIASTDHLTSVLTRFAFYEQAESTFTKLRTTRKPLSCIIMDIDHFKTINDSFGHIAGDQVLRDVAAIMQRNMRENDLLCRFGGEEFCALLPETGIDEARDVAERICAMIGSTVISRIDSAVTVSLGVASVSFERDKPITLDTLIQTADGALYVAKDGGRNRVEIAGQIA